jgi:uncharacterized damage-inducible protein DinB
MNAREQFAYWSNARKLLYIALDRLTDEQLSYAPSPDSWSVGTVFRHIAEAEAGWFTQPITGELRQWEQYTEQAYPTVASIKALLTSVHARTEAYLETLDVEDMERIKFSVFGEETPVSWFIWHVIDHEFHHRGQIFRMMRSIGVEPPIA